MSIPPDPEEMNDERAGWAGLAVAEFARTVFHRPSDREDHETVLMDLLCDLRHWADRRGVNFEKALKHSQGQYLEETGRA